MSQWEPGQSGNPNGRPRKGKSESDKLRDAIKRVAKRKNIDFYEEYAEMALEEPSVMISLMRKIQPDLKSIEHKDIAAMNYGVIVLPAKVPVGTPCVVIDEKVI